MEHKIILILSIFIIMIIVWYRRDFKLWKEHRIVFENYIAYLESRLQRPVPATGNVNADKQMFWDIMIHHDGSLGIISSINLPQMTERAEGDFTMEQTLKLNELFNAEYSNFKFNVNEPSHRRTQTVSNMRQHLISKL